MKYKLIAQIIAVSELITAVPLYAIYTAPFRFFGAAAYWTPMGILANILSVMFIVLPFIALYGISKELKIGYLAIGLFPIVSYVFGVTAIPFVKHLYGSEVRLNSYIIIALNILVVVVTVWLYRNQGKQGVKVLEK